jgi:hypothetical protein
MGKKGAKSEVAGSGDCINLSVIKICDGYVMLTLELKIYRCMYGLYNVFGYLTAKFQNLGKSSHVNLLKK